MSEELRKFQEMMTPFIGKIIEVPNWAIANHHDFLFIKGFDGEVLQYQKYSRKGRRLKATYRVYNFEFLYNLCLAGKIRAKE